jgi:hypothetical protein
MGPPQRGIDVTQDADRLPQHLVAGVAAPHVAGVPEPTGAGEILPLSPTRQEVRTVVLVDRP